MTKTERFKVVAVDDDGTYQLANLDMKKRGVENYTLWALSTVPLKRGQTIMGAFDFDPSGGIMMGKFPTFSPVEDTPPGPLAA